MEIVNRKSVNDRLSKYCVLSKDSDYAEVTEWANGEGIDVNFDDQQITLTYGQLDAINFLTKYLQYHNEEDGQ